MTCRIVGPDGAGPDDKEALKKDLADDDRVTDVMDVGVSADGCTASPHIAVEAARKVLAGEVDRAPLICGTGLGVATRSSTC